MNGDDRLGKVVGVRVGVGGHHVVVRVLKLSIGERVPVKDGDGLIVALVRDGRIERKVVQLPVDVDLSLIHI